MARRNASTDRCARCKTARFVCRHCGKACCEHRAREKHGQHCSCGKCLLAGRHRKA